MLVFDLSACQYIGSTIKHGGGEYGKIVFNKLIETGRPFSCVYSSKFTIDQYFIDTCKKNNILCADYSKNGLIHTLKNINCNIFYSALPYLYGKENFEDIEFIGTIHGLRDIEIQNDKFMHLYGSSFISTCKLRLKETQVYKKYSFHRSYERFNRLFNNKNFKYIVVSEHTKYSIISFFPNTIETNIKVLYSPRTIEKTYHLESDNKFYLLVSGNRWLKNSYRALIAIDNLISKGLVCHNTIVTGECKKSIRSKLKNKEKFIFLPYVSDERLIDLMRKAHCFVYPSLNEGFGYPPLQSMGCGTPVVTSSACSIPEICKDGALYFNPYSISEIENRLLQIEDATIRENLILKGLQQFDAIANKQDQDLIKLIEILINNE